LVASFERFPIRVPTCISGCSNEELPEAGASATA
jgi:hypothetical protein